MGALGECKLLLRGIFLFRFESWLELRDSKVADREVGDVHSLGDDEEDHELLIAPAPAQCRGVLNAR